MRTKNVGEDFTWIKNKIPNIYKHINPKNYLVLRKLIMNIGSSRLRCTKCDQIL